jgi:hypothetical protein
MEMFFKWMRKTLEAFKEAIKVEKYMPSLKGNLEWKFKG